jgi:hypothetical protein
MLHLVTYVTNPVLVLNNTIKKRKVSSILTLVLLFLFV